MVGAGMFQLDSATRLAAKRPTITINSNPIMFFHLTCLFCKPACKHQTLQGLLNAVRCYGIFCMARIYQLGKDTSPLQAEKLPHQKAVSRSVCPQLRVKETYSKNQPERA